MIAYIPHTFHSVPAYYARRTTTVWEHFIDAYCTPSPPHTFHYSSPFVLFTCTLSTTHISLLLPLCSFHLHPSTTHVITPPPSFFSHAPSPPHAFHYSSPFVLFTCTIFTKFRHSDWSVRLTRSCTCHVVSPGYIWFCVSYRQHNWSTYM